MENQLEVNTIQTNKNRDIFFLLSLFFLSILLHQSTIVFGVNLSFADFFCFFILLFLIGTHQLVVPIYPLIFFLLVSIHVIVTAAFYIPNKFMLIPDSFGITSDYVKLIAIFLYLIIGYNLAKINLLHQTLRWYSLFGLFIGALGVLLTVINKRIFSEIFFFGDTRYRGLMIDPNYFSVLQVTALVYISRMKNLMPRYHFLAWIVIFSSIIVSGSKTGLITFICYSLLRIIEWLFLSNKKINHLVMYLVIVVLSFITMPVIFHFIRPLINDLMLSIPSISRVQPLFTDFTHAISGNGSGREETWNAASQVIHLSPFSGTGIGTYTHLAWELFQYDNVAHNTFLQLAAEWGIPLAFCLFFYIFLLLGNAAMSRSVNMETRVLRDIIFVLLIGSMAVSLNNARMLWLFLGALMFFLKETSNKQAVFPFLNKNKKDIRRGK